MPIYEYRCPDCDEQFEKLVKISAPKPECPKCGSADAQKLVSTSGFILKGGGWYKDHYGLKSPSSDGGTKAGSKSESKSKSESGSGSGSSGSSGSSSSSD